MNVILQIHPADNILVALQNLPAGRTVEYNGHSYSLTDPVPAKHKFYMKDFPKDTEIIMYGVLVGRTSVAVKAGSRVSTENSDPTGASDPSGRVRARKPAASVTASHSAGARVTDQGRSVVSTTNIWMPSMSASNVPAVIRNARSPASV